MRCDEILSGLHEILRWLQQSMIDMVFEVGPKHHEDSEDSDDEWHHFEASPSRVKHR